MQYPYIREGQPGGELFTFVVPAEDLLQFSKIERFQQSEGVERQPNYPHILQICEFMRQPHASFAEPILGDLRGWQFDTERQRIVRVNGAFLSVDDGQHRIAALHLLSSKERSRWEFKVTATKDTPFAERCRRFIQQLERLKIDNHLVWQIQHRANLFPNETSKRAYELALALATQSDSPLRGLIRIEERVPRRQPTGKDAEALKPILGKAPPAVALRESTIGIVNVSGIMRDLRQIIASIHSVVRYQDPPRQYEILARVFRVASEIWPREWNDPKQYFLRRADGIAALIQLLVVGSALKQCITTSEKPQRKDAAQSVRVFTEDTFRRVLGYAARYNWAYAKYKPAGMKMPNPTGIARELDALIYHGMPSRQAKTRRVAAG